MRETLREFFAANLVFVYLIYGFAFLSMGLVLSVLERSPLRLPSLGSLWLLAGFGLLHGLLEWTDMAILIREQTGDLDAAVALRHLALVLTGVSFLCLLQYGVDLLAGSAARLRPLHSLPVVVFVVWAGLTAVAGWLVVPVGGPVWIATGQALARYMLALPGAALTAAGLAWLALRWPGHHTPQMPRYLLGCAVAFAAYAFLSGLIVPPAPFFPASALNYESFFAAVGVPVQVWRAVAALAVGALVGETFIVGASRMLEATSRTLATLNESLRAIISEADLNSIFDLVVTEARGLLGTDTSFLSLLSPDEQTLETVASAGIRTEELRRMRLGVEQGLAGRAIRMGRPAAVESYGQEPGLESPVLDVVRAEGLVSGVAAPLVKDGKLLGVLYVFNRRLTRFSPFDADLLATFASEAAIAIDRARLVSDLREEHERLALALAQLQEAERQREEFVSVVAHDLRSPITVINGFVELLQRLSTQQHGTEKEERALANIRSSAGRLQRMVTDLLDASRLEARRLELRREVVDLPQLVADVVERNAELTRGHAVQLAVRGAPPPVSADPGRVEQILSNLLSNAAKYSRPGTPIEVTVAPDAPDQPEAALVSVANQGAGIPPEEIPRLFSRFHRTAATRAGPTAGLGLGLYITKGLVEAHGGRIWVESEPEGRTVFTFSLPAEG